MTRSADPLSDEREALLMSLLHHLTFDDAVKGSKELQGLHGRELRKCHNRFYYLRKTKQPTPTSMVKGEHPIEGEHAVVPPQPRNVPPRPVPPPIVISFRPVIFAPQARLDRPDVFSPSPEGNADSKDPNLLSSSDNNASNGIYSNGSADSFDSSGSGGYFFRF
jgi:hypothetical protein